MATETITEKDAGRILQEMSVKYIYVCSCGTQTEAQAYKMSIGRVMQCLDCKEVRGHVMSRGQGSCWVTIDPKQVDFYDILGVKYDAQDEDGDDDVNQQSTRET